MSYVPPPTPPEGPPEGTPDGPPGGAPGGAATGGTNRRRELWYGIGVALLACLVLPFVSLLAPGPLGMFGLGLLTPLAVLVTGVVLVISDRTRQWGIGLLVGFLVALILGAGACVAILATWDYS